MPEPAPEYPKFRCKNFYNHDPPCTDGWVRSQGVMCSNCIDKGWFAMSNSANGGTHLEYGRSVSGIRDSLRSAELVDNCSDGIAESTCAGDNFAEMNGADLFDTHSAMDEVYQVSFNSPKHDLV